ncbi:hypothetical protein M501DRAFT_1018116 [Patellaria atrata CBS 101060]|uniref:Uncharacterized protein n=1 Tax=Patellaria atrata CBS 101060 TaxID=1346257 RepID=A0A9P4S751_9PEZI|nr:hypothetical protein M501DRAFT_1018116 [Patellaria atrata CBS 101060]
MTSFKATDPRNKVYAVHNLAPKNSVKIHPDCTKSVPEVYKDIIVKTIRHTESLNCISIGRISVLQDKPLTDMPSWIPNFEDFEDSSKFGGPIVNPPGTIHTHRASKSTIPAYRFTVLFDQLPARGFICDEISEIIHYTNTVIPDRTPMFHSIASILATHQIPYEQQTSIYRQLLLSLFPELRLDAVSDLRPSIISNFASIFMSELGRSSLVLSFYDKMVSPELITGRQFVEKLKHN